MLLLQWRLGHAPLCSPGAWVQGLRTNGTLLGQIKPHLDRRARDDRQVVSLLVEHI